MTVATRPPRLNLLPVAEYCGVNRNDPIRFYSWPFFGPLYRRRVEQCLAECRGGRRVLEIGFGSGVTFLNLRALYDEIHGLDLTANVADVAALFARHGVTTHLRTGSVLDMPYEADTFDTVLLISILEHLQPTEQVPAFTEIRRVLKPGGQVVYGVPVERRLMQIGFRLLGYNIREHHFSTERDVRDAAVKVLRRERIVPLYSSLRLLGPVYEVGHFVKPT